MLTSRCSSWWLWWLSGGLDQVCLRIRCGGQWECYAIPATGAWTVSCHMPVNFLYHHSEIIAASYKLSCWYQISQRWHMTAWLSYLRRPSQAIDSVSSIIEWNRNMLRLHHTRTRISSRCPRYSRECETTTLGGWCPQSDKNAVHVHASLDSVVMDHHQWYMSIVDRASPKSRTQLRWGLRLRLSVNGNG
jgi:hypothetical protein